VTSARDLGGPLAPSISARDRINAGTIPGPTMYVSGPFIQHAPYPGTEAYRCGVNGPDDAQAKVRKLVDGKVDVIKLIDQDEMTMEEVRAVVAEAHRLGKPVVAHAHRPEEIRRALAAGVDCFEHTGLATAPEYPPDIIAMLRERTAKMSLGPLWWTPTVEGLLNYEYFRDNREALDEAAMLGGAPESAMVVVEAPLWTETVTNIRDVEFLAFPRVAEVAEIGWSPAASRRWEEFRGRLGAQAPRWSALGVNFYRSPQVPWTP
jgi:hypothetical protein